MVPRSCQAQKRSHSTSGPPTVNGANKNALLRGVRARCTRAIVQKAVEWQLFETLWADIARSLPWSHFGVLSDSSLEHRIFARRLLSVSLVG